MTQENMREMAQTRMYELRDFFQAYIEAALWSTTYRDDDGNDTGACLDKNFGRDDLAKETLITANKECQEFIEKARAMLNTAYFLGYSVEQAGHDFWLTRNRHGTGFWDRDELKGTCGIRLTQLAHEFAEVGWEVDEDGKIQQI